MRPPSLFWPEPASPGSPRTRHRVATPRRCLRRTCRTWVPRDIEPSCGIVGFVRRRAGFVYPEVPDAGRHAAGPAVAESSRRWAVAKHGRGLLFFGEANASGRAPQEETDLEAYYQMAECEDCKGIPDDKGVPVFVLRDCPISQRVSTCRHLRPASGWCLSATIDSANVRRQ